MDAQKTYKLAPGILAKAVRIGIYGDTAEARILQIAKLAARVIHPHASHRFRQYVLTIDSDGLVTTLDRVDAEGE